MNALEIEEAKEVLSYNPDTGIFTWKKAMRKPSVKGRPAGSKDSGGYLRLKIRGKSISCSRLAYAWFNGPIENGLEIDHINRDRADNRLVNLRAVTHLFNTSQPVRTTNEVGIQGVSIYRKTGAYRVRYKNASKGVDITKYTWSLEEAGKIYQALRTIYA